MFWELRGEPARFCSQLVDTSTELADARGSSTTSRAQRLPCVTDAYAHLTPDGELSSRLVGPIRAGVRKLHCARVQSARTDVRRAAALVDTARPSIHSATLRGVGPRTHRGFVVRGCNCWSPARRRRAALLRARRAARRRQHRNSRLQDVVTIARDRHATPRCASYAGMDTAIPFLNVTKDDEYEPLWDVYGRTHANFTSRRAYQVGIGNHEAWYNYTVRHRYPMAHQGVAAANPPLVYVRVGRRPLTCFRRSTTTPPARRSARSRRRRSSAAASTARSRRGASSPSTVPCTRRMPARTRRTRPDASCRWSSRRCSSRRRSISCSRATSMATSAFIRCATAPSRTCRPARRRRAKTCTRRRARRSTSWPGTAARRRRSSGWRRGPPGARGG